MFALAVLSIRSATDSDRDAIWDIFREVVAGGDTYAIDPNISRDDALAFWFRAGTHTYVAELESSVEAAVPSGRISPNLPPGTAASTEQSFFKSASGVVGTYILRPNQSGGGAHVANAAFMVAAHARGEGVGRAMGEHCLAEARQLGFRAMQFNFVVSTNESAIRLWRQLGFEIVGTLPGAFHHPTQGYVEVYVMFRSLDE
jgi:ribosomal protein S18 acetylase RimI-like enzyme